jgi:hypothetical protein
VIRQKWIVICSAAAALACAALLNAQVSPHNPARAAIRAAKPLANAIYAFHDDCGLWPQRLDDLAPRYISEIPAGWQYEWSYENYINLRKPLASDRDYLIVLVVNGDESGWYAGPAGRLEFIDEATPAPYPPPYSADLVRNATAEFDRRIRRDPASTIHDAAKVSYLLEMGAGQAAEAAALAWIDRRPTAWAPRWALRDVLCYRRYGLLHSFYTHPSDRRPSEAYEQQCEAVDPQSYADWRILRNPWSSSALQDQFEDILQKPIYCSRAEWFVAEATFADDAESFARSPRSARGTLQLAVRWEAAAATINDAPTDASFLVYRAVALLQMERFDLAEKALVAAEAADAEGRVWCGGLSAVRAALHEKNSAFEFRPARSADRELQWRTYLNCPPPRP